jgi:16S rRNA (guanine527-N7)-methyltransferase
MVLETKEKIFHTICAKNGLIPTDLQLRQLQHYAILLSEWNKKINLVSRKDEENIWAIHILHSISLLFRIKIEEECCLVDIGTGGGLPGIPLKILRPDLRIVCVDSTLKKINAVSQIIIDLNLNGIKAIWGRAEEICKNQEYQHNFDFVTARAVGPLDNLIRWSEGFLRKKAQKPSVLLRKSMEKIVLAPPALIAFKGGDVSEEIRRVKLKRSAILIDEIELVLNEQEHLDMADKKIVIVRF